MNPDVKKILVAAAVATFAVAAAALDQMEWLQPTAGPSGMSHAEIVSALPTEVAAD